MIKSYWDTLKKEEWKPIIGHEPYEASNLGRIRLEKKILNQFKTGQRSKQYQTVFLGNRVQKKVHRLVLMAFEGQPTNNNLGCHRDDNAWNNRPENLYWGNSKTNKEDSMRNGNHKWPDPKIWGGENHGSAKFSDETVNKIRLEYKGVKGQQLELARKYGMCQSHVSRLVRGIRRSA